MAQGNGQACPPQAHRCGGGSDELALTVGAACGREPRYPYGRAGAPECDRVRTALGQQRVEHLSHRNQTACRRTDQRDVNPVSRRREAILVKRLRARHPLEHADTKHDRAPRVEAAEDVMCVVDEEVCVADRGQTLDEVRGPEHQQQHTREHDPSRSRAHRPRRSGRCPPGPVLGCMDGRCALLELRFGNCAIEEPELSPNMPEGGRGLRRGGGGSPG